MLIQERVHEYTELRRRADLEAGMEPDAAQQIIEDYDPVVQLSLIAVDRRTKQDVMVKCAAEVAQYVRPKLKSVELTTDPEAMETITQRQELSSRLVGLLELAASGKKNAASAHPPATPPEDSTT